MAKRTKKIIEETPQEQKQPEIKSSLDIKVKLEKSLSGRLTVTVKLLQDGKVITEDYDFIQVD